MIRRIRCIRPDTLRSKVTTKREYLESRGIPQPKTIGDDNMIKYSVYECHEYSKSECVMSNITYEEAEAYCEKMITESNNWDTWYEIRTYLET